MFIFFSFFVFLLTDFRFDRDWKKIEAFVGSKTVIQVIIIKIRGENSLIHIILELWNPYLDIW